MHITDTWMSTDTGFAMAFPCPGQGSRVTKKELLLFLP